MTPPVIPTISLVPQHEGTTIAAKLAALVLPDDGSLQMYANLLHAYESDPRTFEQIDFLTGGELSWFAGGGFGIAPVAPTVAPNTVIWPDGTTGPLTALSVRSGAQAAHQIVSGIFAFCVDPFGNAYSFVQVRPASESAVPLNVTGSKP